ncbi:MAG: hypothetical protein KIS81_07940 [Maricaulaceae bacterium]|nr:hypothetical protein [Maricaulaceae bacterium]
MNAKDQNRPPDGAKDDSLPVSPDPLTIAVRAQVAGEAPGDTAREMLLRQTRLIETDLKHRGWQIARERAMAAMAILMAALAFAAVVLVAGVVWSASQYRGLTIQPFSVPQEMEARGLTGTAVAARLLDRLAEMQAQTSSMRAANTYVDSWGDEVAVEIPQTGVSAGELWRFLRAWLGEEVRITGEIVRTPGGALQITARAGGQPAPLIAADENELEDALSQAAEAIFARTQPYRHAVYLMDSGRMDEARSALERLAAEGAATDRKWALAGLMGLLIEEGRYDEVIALGEHAAAAHPDFGLIHSNLRGAYEALGQAEAAHQALALAARHMRSGDDYNPDVRRGMAESLAGDLHLQRHDYETAARIFAQAAAMDVAGAQAMRHQQAYAEMSRRDFTTARRLRGVTEGEFLPGVAMADLYAAQEAYFQHDWRTMLAPLPAMLAAVEEIPEGFRGQLMMNLAPVMAAAMSRIGDPDGGEALLQGLPEDAYPVMIARADIAAARGRDELADALFAAASEAAPSLADADLAWGLARLARGDRDGAAAALREAARRAPLG